MKNLKSPQLLFFITIFLFIGFPSCKKDSGNNPSDLLNLAYQKTKQYYLWTEKLPEANVFKPANSADIYELMKRVRTYELRDRWSFAETIAQTEQSQRGESLDFGFMVKFTSATDMRVSYVYANSSAGLQGLQRTWQVKKVNGKVINIENPADVKYINEVFFDDNIKAADFEFIKPDGSLSALKISKTKYILNTVLYQNVYTRGSSKIGYFVFNEFSSHKSVVELMDTFNYFQAQGVNEMIVDLRYNRGGYVSTQDTLANLLAPLNVGKKQKLMYTYELNERNSSENESTYFDKLGTLNLNRVVFIVSSSSASASELLINNLKPVMDVKLVGDTTYGKPVGFFPIAVGKYNIFPVSFRTVNSQGSADFFDGFPADVKVGDDLLHHFGDEEEANLKQALNYFSMGMVPATVSGSKSPQSRAEIKRIAEINANFADHLPSVTIENRPSKMPAILRQLRQ